MNIYVRLVYRNLRANLDRASLFFELIFPLFFIFVQGPAIGGTGLTLNLGGKVVGYAEYLATGAVTLTVINGGTNAGTQLWFDRKNGMFEQLLMAPLTRAQYILSIILATLIIGVVGSLLVFAFAFPVVGAAIALTIQGQIFIAAALFLGTVFFGSFAITVSVALRSSETFQVVSTFAFFIFLFTSSVFFPTGSAPLAIQIVSLGNPLTYTTDVFRAGIFDALTPLVSLELTILAVEALAMFIVAVLAFRRIRV
ncbi:MAG TPA: ABC transporter permease [Thermoplasmata archaeon]|nr:ABC transporter permease [Thermoplasmata archaeon]